MNKKCSGVSLVEIMMATGIFALIMLPVFLAFTSGNRNLKVTRSEFKAHTAALEIMEQVISLPYDKIPTGHFGPGKIKNGKPMGNSGITFSITDRPNYNADLLIETMKKNGKEKFKKISVTIEFPETSASKRNRKVTIKTLVANENV